MTYDDDDALDRMLSALPLEDPPPALHARILAATVHAPAVVARVRTWEVWAIGIVVAVGVWLTWMVLAQPHASARIAFALTDAVQQSGLFSLATLEWLAAGASAAWWLSMLSVPRARRVEVR